MTQGPTKYVVYSCGNCECLIAKIGTLNFLCNHPAVVAEASLPNDSDRPTYSLGVVPVSQRGSMSRPLTIWSEIGLRWAFQEVDGWTQYLYGWNSLRTGDADERCLWVQNGTYQDFLAIIDYFNNTSRQFIYTALTPEE